MKAKLMNQVLLAMSQTLGSQQIERLKDVLEVTFKNVEFIEKTESSNETDLEMVSTFLSAKRVEGCSDKSMRYYESTLKNALNKIGEGVKNISTDDLRKYLDNYQKVSGASKVTVDNIRRILSSFFSWLEEEFYIIKSPVRRIHKVKTGKVVKETYSDEALELMRDSCENPRDLALIDILASTGMRVGELVKLNRSDIDFQNRECIVTGKGNKQRIVAALVKVDTEG